MFFFLFLPQASAQTLSHFGNSSTACASFSLSIQRRADVMSDFFYFSKLLFWYYQKNIKQLIALETYFTHDVIGSNLMFIVLTLYRFSKQTLLNA